MLRWPRIAGLCALMEDRETQVCGCGTRLKCVPLSVSPPTSPMRGVGKSADLSDLAHLSVNEGRSVNDAETSRRMGVHPSTGRPTVGIP